MLKFKVEFKDDEFKRRSSNLNTNIDRVISAVTDYNAAYAQGWMRQNAPWTDRTGAARSGLMAIPVNQGSVHEIFLAYSVYYGIWLEIANSGRYQVLVPAMREVGQKMLKDLSQVIYR